MYKPVKIALLGPRQIHGEDDVFAMRPFSATLRCTKPDSELYVLNRADFYRTFKLSQDSWIFAFEQAKAKEKMYIKRCHGYLDSCKEVLLAPYEIQ